MIEHEKRAGLPPYTNRGVTNIPPSGHQASNHAGLSHFSKNSKNQKTIEFLKPKFDWFEGRFQYVRSLDDTLPIIMPFIDDQFDEVFDSNDNRKLSPIQRGYNRSMAFYNSGENVLTISYGGKNGQWGVYFKTTGSNSPVIAKCLLDAFGVTESEDLTVQNASPVLITRADVAIDIRGDNAEIFRTAQKILSKTDLKPSCAGSWLTKDPMPDDAGRTLYLKHTNNVIMRIYEKGKEQIFKYGLNPGDVPIDWVRVEVQFKSPDGSNAKLWKAAFAHLNPKQMFETVEPFVLICNALTGLNLSFNPIQYSIKKELLGIDKFAHYLASTFYRKLKILFDGQYGLHFIYSLYGSNFDDYPPMLQTLALKHYLSEIDIDEHGEF